MAYATLAQMRALLKDVKQDADTSDLLTAYLDRATDIVDLELGFGFADYGSVATAKDLRLRVDSEYLRLPYYQAGSITAVAALSAKGTTSETTEAITDYAVLDDKRLWREAVWTAGWYRVTAKWGYGPAPASIVQLTLEIAVNLWRGRDNAGYSDVVGAGGGGAVGYERGLTNRQRMILQDVRNRYGEYGIG